MSLARGPLSRLMTTARHGPMVTPRTFASLVTRRPGLPRQECCVPVASRAQARHMHWTSVIESAVHVSEDALVGLHSVVGLPWYLAIPALAMGVNLVVRFPLQFYNRKILLKQFAAAHFVRAWSVRHQKMFSPTISAVQMRKSMARLFRQRGCQSWKMYAPLLSVAPWLVVSDALRRITGAGPGLISLLIPETPVAHTVDDASPTAVATDVFAGQDVLAGVPEVTKAVEPVVDSVQQSLATGGALWFPDLSAADPYTILPLALSLSFLHNVLPTDRESLRRLLMPGQDEPIGLRAKMGLRLQRALVLVALLAPFITMNIPAGMLLYWVSSSVLAGLNTLVLDTFYPTPTPAERKSAARTGQPITALNDEVRS